MSDCLGAPNPRTQGLGPIESELTTFHIKERATLDLVDRMLVVLRSAHNDLKEYEAVVEAFWEQCERSGGHMPQDKVASGVEMLTEWRDRKRGGIQKEVVAEAQKYFGIDDGIVPTPEPTPQEISDEAVVGTTGGEVSGSGSGGSRKKKKRRNRRRRR